MHFHATESPLALILVDNIAIWVTLTVLSVYEACDGYYDRLHDIYTVFQNKKLDPLLFHYIFALRARNDMKISRST